jgi:hypothetical protein
VARPSSLTAKAALAAIAVAFAFSAGARPVDAAPGMELALQDDAVVLQRLYYDRDRALDQIRGLGVTRIRSNLLWTSVLHGQARSRRKPRHLRYDWSAYDALVVAAGQHGMAVQFNLTGPAPAFATSNHRVGVRRPSARRFGEFAAAAAAHFRGHVNRYAIWNEPNYVGWLAPRHSAPKLYRHLYPAGWSAVKRQDGGAAVLIGETVPYAIPHRAMAPLAFLRKMTCVSHQWRRRGHCRPLVADGYAHHPYEFRRPPEAYYPGHNNVTMGTLYRLTAALDRLARAHALRQPNALPLDIYLTEFGYFGSGKRGISDAKRGTYLAHAVYMARRNPRVRQFLQYLLVQPPRSMGNFTTGIVSMSGQPMWPYWTLGQAAH